jgi:hypothetical protein
VHELAALDLPSGAQRVLGRTRKAEIDRGLEKAWAYYHRAVATANREYTKAEHYCRE